MLSRNLPIQVHPVLLSQPQTTNGGFTSGVCTLKQTLKAWLYVYLTNAVGFAQVLTPMQATNIAAGTNAVLPAVPIWANEDTVATDTLVAQTAAANYTTGATAKNKVVIFEIDPAVLTAGYPCIYLILSNSAQATNFATVVAHLWQANQVATPTSAILN
jgi:hypothetical protein